MGRDRTADNNETPGDELARLSDQTRQEERREATTSASAGRGPTPEEAEAAERNDVDPEVARNNKEAVERGATVRGEGQLD